VPTGVTHINRVPVEQLLNPESAAALADYMARAREHLRPIFDGRRELYEALDAAGDEEVELE
jgi:hypothetical protein